MKVHYINMLLFAVPLNILIYNQRNHYITTLQTQTNRTLCECELYAPANYDNDPQMKLVMQQFEDRTSQRFHEYDERMKTTRQKCKDQCDKEIQKIILKDKLEKQMAQQFATLDTDIQNDAIPTCVCEKSMADKVEKGCLRCGGLLGGGVAPGWGLISGLGYEAWTNYVAGISAKAATDAGISTAIKLLKTNFSIESLTSCQWKTYVTSQNYANESMLGELIRYLGETLCGSSTEEGSTFCLFKLKDGALNKAIKGHIPTAVKEAVRDAATAEATAAAKYTSTTSSLTTTITASIVAIVVIILIMVIIYLILRYRRKKKMKKKMQYIKLLEK
nr:PIR protein, putative [Plasmodium sp. DRC-Itaito]